MPPKATPTVVPSPTPIAVNNGFIVNMSDELGFTPKVINVVAGTTVTWVILPGVLGQHATGTEPWNGPILWQSDWLKSGEKFSFTFNTPGRYPYYCEVVPMYGVVYVSAQ
jgi:plastocyanin